MATKTENAERIALHARVFVRAARRDGYANLIDTMALLGAAQTLKLWDTDGWTVRKAARLTVTELKLMDELHIIDWSDEAFAPLKPRWMR